MSTSKRALVTTLGVTAIFALSGSALAAPGGNGNGGGGGGGGGGSHHAADPTLAIATQQQGSVTFSVMVPSSQSGPGDMVVTVTCYDVNSSQNYSSSVNVVWSTNTVGYAGPFAPPSGESCFTYVHTPGSDVPLPGGTYSFVAAYVPSLDAAPAAGGGAGGSEAPGKKLPRTASCRRWIQGPRQTWR